MTATPRNNVTLVHTVAELRAAVREWRNRGESVAIVPTMGALHAGHISLVARARQDARRIVATVFVNPTQFAAGEDFSKYPRTLGEDLEKLGEVAADLCFAPSVEEMYGEGFSTSVHVEGPATVGLEDKFRPTHFQGVATIVAKLLNQAQADAAVFGEKDYQQLQVIRRLARDLDIDTKILSAPTLRDADGLAMSSRNVYLSPQERAIAPTLYRELETAADRIRTSEPIDAAVTDARRAVEAAGFVVDYLEARHGDTLERVARSDERPLRLLVAARIGQTRLIDNIAV